MIIRIYSLCPAYVKDRAIMTCAYHLLNNKTITNMNDNINVLGNYKRFTYISASQPSNFISSFFHALQVACSRVSILDSASCRCTESSSTTSSTPRATPCRTSTCTTTPRRSGHSCTGTTATWPRAERRSLSSRWKFGFTLHLDTLLLTRPITQNGF